MDSNISAGISAAEPATAAAVAARELKTSEPLAARAIADTARLGILTPAMEVSLPGLKKVHEALVAAGLVAGEPFDAGRVVDASFLRASR